MSRNEQALNYAELNVKTNNNSPDAASTYGWVLYRMGKKNEAEQVLNKAYQLAGSMSPDLAYYMAQVQYDLNKKDIAKHLVDSVLKGDRHFSMKKEAKELQAKLNKELPAKDAAEGPGQVSRALRGARNHATARLRSAEVSPRSFS